MLKNILQKTFAGQSTRAGEMTILSPDAVTKHLGVADPMIKLRIQVGGAWVK